MKTFGIYLMYQPGVDLRKEGLGRHLTYFLKASTEKKDTRFIIACPRWMHKSLSEIFSDALIDPQFFKIISPDKKSIRIYCYQSFSKLMQLAYRTHKKIRAFFKKTTTQHTSIGVGYTKLFFKIYDKPVGIENMLLGNLCNSLEEVSAWYCPTLFWPSINLLHKPKLVCAPDVVLNNFPIGFAVHCPSAIKQYLNVVDTINYGQYFTTYSEDVKINTLVNNYNIDPKNVFVIHHGANRLDNLLDTQAKSEALFAEAMATARKGYYANYFATTKDMKFIFYASQVRPNKNILTLLKAYHSLLRNNKITHKLILTGDPKLMNDIQNFITDNQLDRDVLWFQGISSKQLAACYALADLSINPTLSEGGFPFTFTESLSVNTPTLMSRINVTTEIITDPELQSIMLFNPYDQKNMADKLEWALQNKEFLLTKQLPLYEQLAQRTWRHVVDDYISVLNRIASEGTTS